MWQVRPHAWSRSVSSISRRDAPHPLGKAGVRSQVGRSMFALDACRILAEAVIASPVLLRPNWPGNEVSAAIGAVVSQQLVCAGAAEGAFEAADARLGGIRRQCLAAVFADWSEFEHRVLLSLWDIVASAGCLERPAPRYAIGHRPDFSSIFNPNSYRCGTQVLMCMINPHRSIRHLT
jgi:hypothetical protein